MKLRIPGNLGSSSPSIARNLTVSLMLTVSCVTLLVTAAFTMHQLQKDKANLRENADEISGLAAQSLSLPLWFLHTDSIEEIGRAYSSNRLVLDLDIRDIEGVSLYSFEADRPSKNVLRRNRDITYKGEVLGSLEIAFSSQRLQTNKNRLLVLGGLVTVLVCLALLLITGASLRLFLNRPVNRLQSLVEHYSGGMPELPDNSPPREFAGLDRTFRSMAGRIRSQVDALAQAEARYRSLFQNAMEGMYRVSLAGRLLMVNPSMASMLGYDSPQELLDNATDVRATLYVDPDERGRFLQEMRQYGRVTNFETVFNKKDGSQLWVRLGAILISDEGEIQGYCEDVTRQVEARQALIAAKEEAEAASQLKSDFLSMVSHELRTPLTSVLGFSKLIQKRLRQSVLPHAAQLGPPQKKAVNQVLEQLEIIVNEAERLTRLINNVLGLAKLEAGRMDLEIQSCAVQNIMERAVKATQEMVREKGLEISLELPADLPMVFCDPDRVHQVLINLISNAARFTEKGELRHSARLQENTVVFSVQDQGPGIDLQQQQFVFEKFRQLGDTVEESCTGSGLGLAICRQIIEQHGGRIWFENRTQGGCDFMFTLPLAG